MIVHTRSTNRSRLDLDLDLPSTCDIANSLPIDQELKNLSWIGNFIVFVKTSDKKLVFKICFFHIKKKYFWVQNYKVFLYIVEKSYS